MIPIILFPVRQTKNSDQLIYFLLTNMLPIMSNYRCALNDRQAAILINMRVHILVTNTVRRC